MPQGGNLISLILSVLAGAGFDKFSKGTKNLAESGQDLQSLFSLPNFPLLLAGAGLKDSANSMELIAPLIKQFTPPPQPQGPNPQELSAAMSMLSARLSPGLGGIQAPPSMPSMPMAPNSPMGGM